MHYTKYCYICFTVFVYAFLFVKSTCFVSYLGNLLNYLLLWGQYLFCIFNNCTLFYVK